MNGSNRVLRRDAVAERAVERERAATPRNALQAEGREGRAVEPVISLGGGARDEAVSEYSLGVIRGVLRQAGLSSATVTSATRSPGDQARVMYNNLGTRGVRMERRLYGPGGNQVIDVYEASRRNGMTSEQIKGAMEAAIRRIGPGRVSRHCGDPSVLNVIDIAPSSIRNEEAFRRAVRAERRIHVFLVPPSDTSYHLEIPQRRSQ